MTAAVNVTANGVTTAYSAGMYLPAGSAVTLTLTSPAAPTAAFVTVKSSFGPLGAIGTLPLNPTTLAFQLAMPPVPATVTVMFQTFSGAQFTGPDQLTLQFTVASGQVPVQDFGATGNGTTDDSGAIQAAVNALAGSGLALYLGAGTYNVTAAAITNPSDVPILLGPGAVITGTNAASLANMLIGASLRVRGVITALGGSSYTGSGTSTLTCGSNTALGTQDTNMTPAVGDQFMLPAGTSGSQTVTAKDAGPWEVSVVGSGTVPWVLVRPSWWTTGDTMPVGCSVAVGQEGALFPNEPWTSWAAPGTVIGTTDPAFYPDTVITQITLAASTFALTTIPFRSASKTHISCQLVGGSPIAGTVGYGTIAAMTPGALGTASATIVAIASGQTKNGTTDTAVLNVKVSNK